MTEAAANIKIIKRQVEIGSTGAFTSIFFLLDDSYIIWMDTDVRGNARWRWARKARNEGRIGYVTHGARDSFEHAVQAVLENAACWKEIGG